MCANIKYNLDPQDHQLFQAMSQFFWIQGEPLPLIFDIDNGVYTDHGISPEVLKHLDSIGLIILEFKGFIKKGFGKHTRLFYCGQPIKISFQNDRNNYLDLGYVLLTEQGKNLATSLKVSRNQQFYEYVIKKWFQQGLILSSIQIDRNQKSSCAK